MTKEPFESLSEPTMKLLTYKTVLVALLSGNHRSEIYVWLHSSVFFNHDGSKVTVAPPAFRLRAS